MGTQLTEEFVKKEINKKGKSFSDKRVRFSFVSKVYVNGQWKVKIQCSYTEEIKVLRFQDIMMGSPFGLSANIHPKIVEENINLKGKEPKDKREHFKFVKVKKGKNGKRILVESLFSQKQKWADYSDLMGKNQNPFRLSSKLQEVAVENLVNLMGKKPKSKIEQFKFIKTYTVQEEGKHKSRKVVIQNLVTRERKHSFYQSIKNGFNPFNRDKDNHEVRVVHPIIYRALRKMGFEEVIYEDDSRARLSRRSKPDFVCISKKGKKIVVEAKSDQKRWNPTDLQSQTSKYYQDAKKKFGKDFGGVFLVSVKGGIHGGYSIKDLKSVFRAKGLI